MTKLKCIIIDDEPLAHNIILEYAKDVSYLDIVAQAYLPTNALQIIKNETIDLIFLDIQMPKLNGLEMLRLLDHQPEVIITSAYEEYALESYELQVVDYLLKPFRLDRFIQATDKAFANYKQRTHSTKVANNKILIKSDKRLIQVDENDIYYLQSYGNYVKIHTQNECIVTARTLHSFEDQLDPKLFFKIHKSYIINRDHMDYIEGNQVIMHNDKVLSVSKHVKSEFMTFMGK